MFRLSDGAALTLPATRPVGHYDVRAESGRLEVELP
jgi:nitrite reductase/ring-hydroxylating ferredoxin subunit